MSDLGGRVQVVPSDVPARAVLAIESGKHLTALTCTRSHWVALSRIAQNVYARLARATAMLSVVLPARDDLQVLGPIVRLVAVQVMHYIALLERPAEHLRRDQAVFVDVSANVGERMSGYSQQHVSMLSDGAPASPYRIRGALLK